MDAATAKVGMLPEEPPNSHPALAGQGVSMAEARVVDSGLVSCYHCFSAQKQVYEATMPIVMFEAVESVAAKRPGA